VNVRLSPRAEAQARRIARYYNRRQSGLGEVFLNRLELACDAIGRQPQSFSPVQPPLPGRDVRWHKVRRFPYIVVYEVLPDGPVVLAVYHQHRRPSHWRRSNP
jgi:toxin ParE2